MGGHGAIPSRQGTHTHTLAVVMRTDLGGQPDAG
jgi:hypothetical protein